MRESMRVHNFRSNNACTDRGCRTCTRAEQEIVESAYKLESSHLLLVQ